MSRESDISGLQPGSTLAHRYRLEARLGEGAMGRVFRAVDSARGDSEVAIKILTDTSTLDWFRREFETVSMMVHPGIAQVYDFGHDDDNDVDFYTSQFVRGLPATPDLHAFTFPMVVDLSTSLLKALHYIHSQGYLHCDIKPGNVMVLTPLGEDPEIAVKILDFGLATSMPQSQLTARGTLAYMAPEWFDGGIPGPYTDLYSTGVMLYQMTYSSLPFDVQDAHRCIEFHKKGSFTFEPVDGYPEWWFTVLRRLVATDPAERFGTPREVLETLSRHMKQPLNLMERDAGSFEAVGGPWVGRSEAFDRLMSHIHASLETSGSGQGPLQVVGQTGVGKSRLLAEARRRLQVAHVHVTAVDGSQGESFAQLRALLGRSESTSQVLDQDRLSHMVTQLVSNLWDRAERTGSVLLMDTVENLDEPTLAFLKELHLRMDYARGQGTPSRLAVVLAGSRTEGLPSMKPSVLELRAFNTEETGGFLSLLLGVRALPEGLLTEAQGATKGNPALLAEWVTHLQTIEALSVGSQGVRFDPAKLRKSSLPETISQFIQSAIQALSDEELLIAQYSALAFEPLHLSDLTYLMNRHAWEIELNLLALSRLGLLQINSGEGKSRAIPLSHLHRELLTHSVDDARLSQHHKQLFDALVHRGGDLRSHSPGLAWHAFHAGMANKAAEFALEGARRLIRQHRFDGAARLVDVARECAVRLQDVGAFYARLHRLSGTYEDGIARLRELCRDSNQSTATMPLRLDISDLAFGSGQYELALEEAKRGLDSGETSLEGRACAWISRSHFYLGHYDEARQWGERGMLSAPRESRDFALSAAMVGLVRTYQGNLRQGLKYLQTARPILKARGYASDAAFGANIVGLAHHKLKEYEDAWRCYQDSLAIALEAGDNERTSTARTNLSVLAQERGDYAEAITQYQESLGLAHQSDNRPLLARITNNLGNVYRYLGLLLKARDYATRSLELAQAQQQEHLTGLNQMLLAEIHLFEGECERADQHLSEALRVFTQLEATDEQLECAIDQVELLIEMKRWNNAIDAGSRTLQEAVNAQMENHRLRAAIALAAACLGGDGGALATGLEALQSVIGLLDSVGTPELRWKHATYLALTLIALKRETVGEAFASASSALDALERQIPEEFRQAYFVRRDRRRLKEQMARLQVSALSDAPTVVFESNTTSPGDAFRNRWMETLVGINRRLVGEHDLEKVLEAIIDRVVDLSGAQRGFVILQGDQGLDVVVARNMDQASIRRSRGKFSTTVARNVLRTGEVVRLADAVEAEDFREQKSVMAMRIRSVIGLPLMARGAIIGALYLDNRFKAGVFDDVTVEMLKAFSEQAALAIENARLLHRYRTTVAQLETSQEEVQRLNQELQEQVHLQEALLKQQDDEIARQKQALEERFQFTSIVGQSPPLRAMFQVMDRVKDTHVPVLITGESGVGKELVARALHFNGERSSERFVSISCAALPDSLLESELFGYAKGAFTGADGDKKGLFTLADRGTLFLDELGDMSLSMQAKLLRVIQEGEFSPLGSEALMRVDVRIVAATNRDLKTMVEEKSFRQDLYYRLDVVSIRVPSLRERRDDIPLLVEHFLSLYAADNDAEPIPVMPDAMQVLLNYDWTGNIRELQSVVLTAAVFADNGRISRRSLETKPEVFQGSGTGPSTLQTLGTLDLKALEKQAVTEALQQCKGNKQQAARVLGISRRALYNKLEAHKIKT